MLQNNFFSKKTWAVLGALLFVTSSIVAQKTSNPKAVLFLYEPLTQQGDSDLHAVKPLQKLGFSGRAGTTVDVTDGRGKSYASFAATPLNTFVVQGALGKHTVTIYDKAHVRLQQLSFEVEAQTGVDDGGTYKKMFDLFYNSMRDKTSEEGSVVWNGKRYHYFVPWGLDHFHTGKGLKYFSPYGAEFVDLMRLSQREDGMIWSFVQYMPNADYFLTRDKWSGYSRRIGDKVFVRQPTENHPEYIFVNTIYQCWKANGDSVWMQKNLDAAIKALNYTINDPARWSKRFGLLKRVYTIDSWDFEVEDAYLPDIGITNTMIIDPEKSKFGVFFGDNTGYITACYQLAEMLQRVGRDADFKTFKARGDELKARLDKLAWNGKFFTHFIDEDSTVHRDLGVDEKAQIAQSNAYSLNRDISAAQQKAIIETYQDLQKHVPVGAPAEWYAIYPPFEKGFTQHDQKWQYMNGGVGGHVAGELARGAYEAGYETYGTDILNRLYVLGKKYNNKIYFAYTGSIPPPPPAPAYTPLNLLPYTNMDFWDKGSNEAKPWMLVKRNGDDLRNLPAGEQTFNNIRFNVLDPEKNNRKAVVAVSHTTGLPAQISIPVNDTAACVYLLHTASKPSSENVCGLVTFEYADGTKKNNYIIMGKQLTYWWFSELQTEHSGIAWYGRSGVSEGVGLSWCALDNPEPHKQLKNIILEAAADNTIYTVFGITLSDQQHYVPVNPVSFGGPDNWAAATAMAALIEGLAGVKDAPHSEAFAAPMISPRWVTTNDTTVNVTVRYGASKGYVAYQYSHDSKARTITFTTAGNADAIQFHVLLPSGATVQRVIANNQPIAFEQTRKEASVYADFNIHLPAQHYISIQYQK